MRTLKNLIIIMILLAAQSALIGRLDLWGIRPNISVLILLFMAQRTGSAELILYGFFMGFLQDIYTPERLGFGTLSLSILAYLIDVGKKRVSLDRIIFKIMAVFVATLVYDLIHISLYAGLNIYLMGNLFVMDGFPGAVYTAFIAGLLMIILEIFFQGGTTRARHEFARSRK